MKQKKLGIGTTLTTGQIAKICRVAPRTVSKWIDSGQMRGFRFPETGTGKMKGKDRRVLYEDLVDFFRRNDMPLSMLQTDPAASPVPTYMVLGTKIQMLPNSVYDSDGVVVTGYINGALVPLHITCPDAVRLAKDLAGYIAAFPKDFQ